MHALAQQLTGKKTLDDCSIDEVRHIAHRHPYFAPAQFLLLQKLRQAGSPEEADAQYRKAVLFFHDPLLFEHFISSNKFYVEEIASVTTGNGLPEESEAALEKEDAVSEVADTNTKITPGSPDETIAADTDINDEPLQTSGEELQEDPHQAASNADIFNEHNALIVGNEEVNVAALEKTEIDNIVTPPTATAEVHPTIIEAQKNELAFEPFHTVDYFASQGIKISQDELPKDKLGKQLKSFTEWLRTMKRLPATQITDVVESSAEKKVESMASHSVSESDVVTEAMAEVWLKQGKTGKALDIYNKLSLLNPSKKAYFAAKIEHLKPS